MTPKQTLIMWCLLGKHGEAFQSEIVPRIAKKDRETLVSNGFITDEKRGRALILKVEDKGWHWAGEHLGDELPPNFLVLRNWLAKVHQHLERNGQTLAEFIGSPPEHAADPSTVKLDAGRPRKAATATRKKTPKPLTVSKLIVRSPRLAVRSMRSSSSGPTRSTVSGLSAGRRNSASSRAMSSTVANGLVR
jgi:hypothetical protein